MAFWDKISSRGNVEDRRGMSPIALGGGGLGLAGVAIVLLFNILGGGVDPNALNGILNQLQQTQGAQQQRNADEFKGADSYETFASTVLGSNNDLWRDIFKQSGKTYAEPKLVLFRGATQSGCGLATAQVGPHYCPADNTIYLDETFFDELKNRFGAQGGDVAEAYVIAHEVAHHVQNELGIMDEVHSAQQSGSDEANALSIRLELQADCFAGVWAYSVSHLGVFQPGEINEAIDAASAVGDDRIQEKVQGQVSPETWTHGSSKQRVDAFNKGFTTGKPASCSS
ncbi:MAG TPA: neutral zinc metallopeptidase [Candidatus Saccharimonadales bacterium]|nr:neutral zinc metallopeptidase [Candidatus Saccharimonadales bacterium]